MKKFACLVLFLLLLPAFTLGAAAAEETTNAPLTYQQSFSADHTLSGFSAKTQESFLLGDWEIHSLRLRLEYAATPLLGDQTAEITLSLNNQIFHRFSFSGTNGGRQVLEIDCPTQPLYLGMGNNLTIESHVPLEEDCTDDGTSDWINLFKESSISAVYTPRGYADNIAGFYQAFTSLEALDNAQSAILIPDQPTAAELSTAANAAAYLSARAPRFYERIDLIQGLDLANPPAQSHLLCVAEWASLPEEIAAMLDDEQRAAAENGALMIFLSLEGRKILLITGSGEGFLQAARALGNPEWMNAQEGHSLSVPAREDLLTAPASETPYLLLTEDEVLIQGYFQNSTTFYLNNPAGRRLTEASEVDLDFRYAEILDFDRALVTVYLDDRPIGSKKLSKEKAGGDNLRLSLPEDLDISGSFALRVSFDLGGGENWCHTPPEEEPWALIEESSMLKISAVDPLQLDFAYYPAPFIRNHSWNDTVFLLPAAHDEADLEALHGMALTLGRDLRDNRGEMYVAFFDESEPLPAANLIAIGAGSSNPLMQTHKDLLPFHFSNEWNRIAPHTQWAGGMAVGSNMGLAQIIPSPYSESFHALMLVSGADSAAMSRAADWLGSQEKLGMLSGDAFTADGEQLFPFRFGADGQSYDIPAAPKTEESPDFDGKLLALGGLLGLLLLTATLIIWRNRRLKP